MAKYRVDMSAVSSLSVRVEVDDTDDEDRDLIEDAIEKAYEEHGAGICAQCSGWRQPWSLDLGDIWETDAVEDADGKEVWRAPDMWHRARPSEVRDAVAAEVTKLAGLVEAEGVGTDGGFVDGIRTAVDLLVRRAAELRG